MTNKNDKNLFKITSIVFFIFLSLIIHRSSNFEPIKKYDKDQIITQKIDLDHNDELDTVKIKDLNEEKKLIEIEKNKDESVMKEKRISEKPIKSNDRINLKRKSISKLKNKKSITKNTKSKILQENNDKNDEIVSDLKLDAITENDKFIDINGIKYKYDKKISGKATAYAPTGNKTASGTVPKENRTVAVNKNKIPFGKKVAIKVDDKMSIYEAEDTGAALKGNKCLIDIFMNSKEKCKKFGRREVDVFVLK